MEERAEQFALLDFSIYSLPVEQQGVFKGLLLIPVAALIVVIMRILVGLKTSGTFMPILIALAFLQTTLMPGLSHVPILVSVGLWIRSWLSYMNLLLVSRISAVVIVVIFLMAATGYRQLSAGPGSGPDSDLFPHHHPGLDHRAYVHPLGGGRHARGAGAGRGQPAGCRHGLPRMSNRVVEHLTFNFPGADPLLAGYHYGAG